MADLPVPFLFFDKYELRARLAPAVLLVLPVVFPVRLLLPAGVLGWFEALLVTLPVLYGLTFIVRALGRRAEPRLWQSWGGPPSTRLCRWRDDRMGRQKKTLLHAAVAHHLHTDLYSAQKERARPEEADHVIADAFGRVRELLRKKDPTGLWSAHNAEYGFARNFLASATLAALLSLISAVVCGVAWLLNKEPVALTALPVDTVMALGFLVCRLWAMPAAVKFCADRYAESAWEAFLVLADSGAPATAAPTPTDHPRQGATETPTSTGGN
jgi:hypothetical protein